jgi:hypothetical protein
MDNSFPIVKVDIFATPSITKNILLRAACFAKDVVYYKSLFKGFWDIFTWSYSEMIGLDPTIFEHHIYKKSMSIKVDIEKVWKAKFIHPITYKKIKLIKLKEGRDLSPGGFKLNLLIECDTLSSGSFMASMNFSNCKSTTDF